MNIRVAHHTVPGHHAVTGEGPSESLERGVRRPGVPGRVMTALAQLRRFSYKKGIVVAAVGDVTVEAVFGDGGMVLDEWPPLFRVAAVPQVVCGIGLQQFRTGAAVWKVAFCACDPPLSYGMTGPPEGLRPYIAMTGEAQPRHRRSQLLVPNRSRVMVR